MASSSFLGPIARRLEGKVAIITGGASGIGASAAKLFHQHGAKVVITDVQDELGQALCQHLHPDLTYAHCDVSNEDDVSKTIDRVVETHGKLDIMFNNAGIGGSMNPRIIDAEKANLEKVLSVNLVGAFLGAKHAARVMVPARQGTILFTSSAAAVICPSLHAYACSKHAVVGLTKTLGAELGQFGIRVNCISPYGAATPGMEKNTGWKAIEIEKLMSRAANLKGVVHTAEDIANAALYLASDESKYVSGLNLVVDGGYSTVNPSLSFALAEANAKS
uniref:Secoisolariciresinol dehydrogenase 2 n=1 Tax=Kadsura heteroclita TaxID=124781 RepID=A0A7U3VH25_9MAGN|nr:secoisolariciresinol dehydrogenase 2 [Kadsura heteroclita]